jgi:hypothetical protein
MHVTKVMTTKNVTAVGLRALGVFEKNVFPRRATKFIVLTVTVNSKVRPVLITTS